LVVLGKQPLPGQVKTRMCPPLRLEQAAELYAALLADVLETTQRLSAALGLTPLLALHPPAACEPMAASVPPGITVVAQHGAALAERMSGAVAQAAAGGASPVLLRGSDSPTLDQSLVAEALAALEAADVVLSPDADGGYGLIGLRRPVPGLFEHAMSTASVLADTRANAESRGLRVATVRPGFDLDTVADLARLQSARDAKTNVLCPRLLSYLDTHDLWRMLDAG
jgi:rSAM/selenodomain-associated transferase 1